MITFLALHTFSELSNSQQLLRTSWRSCLSTSWELLENYSVVENFSKWLSRASWRCQWFEKNKKTKKICFLVVCSLSVSLSVCFGDLKLTFEHLRQLWSLSLWFTVSNFLVKMAMDTKKLFQFSEVETHANPTDCWLIIHGKVNCVLQLHSSFFLSILITFS
jgi:cytochrome b involved in lipid metabolism